MSTVGRILRRLDTPDDIAARERRRIRRLIAPHLKALRGWLGTKPCNYPGCGTCPAVRAIDAATRAPKKARTK